MIKQGFQHKDILNKRFKKLILFNELVTSDSTLYMIYHLMLQTPESSISLIFLCTSNKVMRNAHAPFQFGSPTTTKGKDSSLKVLHKTTSSCEQTYNQSLKAFLAITCQKQSRNAGGNDREQGIIKGTSTWKQVNSKEDGNMPSSGFLECQ